MCDVVVVKDTKKTLISLTSLLSWKLVLGCEFTFTGCFASSRELQVLTPLLCDSASPAVPKAFAQYRLTVPGSAQGSKRIYLLFCMGVRY